MDKDFGIGVVRYEAMYEYYNAHDVIRTGPSASADTVAVLRRDSLCFAAGGCVYSYGRMIHFDYEIPGWAILRFAEDSTWVEVNLAPSDSGGLTGWVALGDRVRALLWPSLVRNQNLFFIRWADIAFYRSPGDAAPLARDLAKDPGSERLDYTMRPLETRGAWMRVVLTTPSTMCESPAPKGGGDTLWIQYLTPEHRPRVYWHTRGC